MFRTPSVLRGRLALEAPRRLLFQNPTRRNEVLFPIITILHLLFNNFRASRFNTAQHVKSLFFIQVHKVPAVLAPPKKTSQKYVTTQPPCKKVPTIMCVIKILITHHSGCPNISKRRRSNKNPVLKTNTVVWAEFQQFPVYPINIHHCRERGIHKYVV